LPEEYVLYVDDSGTKDYPGTVLEFKKPNPGCSRYFVWGAVLLRTDVRDTLANEISHLKMSIFGVHSVEIKSNWLRIPKERKRRYLEPYCLEDWQLDDFVDQYYEAIINTDCQFIAIVVDKLHMMERYTSPFDPAWVAYDYLLDRVQREMNTCGPSAICYVNMDSIDGKLRGVEHAKSFKKLHEDLKCSGASWRNGPACTRIKGALRLVDSAGDHLIQVADIVAYNVLRQFRDYGESWEDATLTTLPHYDYFGRMLHKFRKGPGNRIQGFGVVKVPMKRRVPWAVTEE
jgi:hypothetical protein